MSLKFLELEKTILQYAEDEGIESDSYTLDEFLEFYNSLDTKSQKIFSDLWGKRGLFISTMQHIAWDLGYVSGYTDGAQRKTPQRKLINET